MTDIISSLPTPAEAFELGRLIGRQEARPDPETLTHAEATRAETISAQRWRITELERQVRLHRNDAARLRDERDAQSAKAESPLKQYNQMQTTMAAQRAEISELRERLAVAERSPKVGRWVSDTIVERKLAEAEERRAAYEEETERLQGIILELRRQLEDTDDEAESYTEGDMRQAWAAGYRASRKREGGYGAKAAHSTFEDWLAEYEEDM